MSQLISFFHRSSGSFTMIGVLLLLTTSFHVLAAPQGSGSSEIDRRWDELFGDQAVEPEPAPEPAARTAPSSFANFADQLDYRISVDYIRNFVSFTDEPTRTLIVDDGLPLTTTPEGYFSFPPMFESGDARLHTRATFGTRGFGHERLRTEVSVISTHDLNGTSTGSPFQSVLDTFGGRSRTEALKAFFEINGLGEGRWSNLDLRVGRQYTQGSFNLPRPLGASVMDGVAFDYRDQDFDLGAFVGYRPTFFSDPKDRVVTGANFGINLARRAYARYQFFHYAGTGIHSFSVEPLWEHPLQLRGSYTQIDGDPIDLGVRASYAEGNWSVYASFQEKLTAHDLEFDVFSRSPAEDSLNQNRRLHLGEIATSSRFSLDVTRQLGPLFAVGGRVWILELHDEENQTGFDSSFQDLSAHLAFFPAHNWDAELEYRHRNTDRLDPLDAVLFDDTRHAGETEYDEIIGGVGYRHPGRFKLHGGLYHRVFDTQNRITLIEGSSTTGFFANLFIPVNRHWDFRLSYGVDNDFSVFNPDIDLQQTLRIGFDVHN
jgi:hypothetical protein